MNPVIVDDGVDMLMIDCGVQDSMDELKAAARQQGVDLSRLTRLIITHHDHDHAGNLAAILREHPGIEVIASAIDKPYIEKTVVSPRIAWSQEAAVSMPEHRETFERLIVQFSRLEPARVDIGAVDGQRFPWLGGVEIVATPGHLPGHIAVFLHAPGAMVTGDAMNISGDALDTANALYTPDMASAARSTLKMAGYPIQTLICYHGGAFGGDIPSAMERLLTKYDSL